MPETVAEAVDVQHRFTDVWNVECEDTDPVTCELQYAPGPEADEAAMVTAHVEADRVLFDESLVEMDTRYGTTVAARYPLEGPLGTCRLREEPLIAIDGTDEERTALVCGY